MRRWYNFSSYEHLGTGGAIGIPMESDRWMDIMCIIRRLGKGGYFVLHLSGLSCTCHPVRRYKCWRESITKYKISSKSKLIQPGPKAESSCLEQMILPPRSNLD